MAMPHTTLARKHKEQIRNTTAALSTNESLIFPAIEILHDSTLQRVFTCTGIQREARETQRNMCHKLYKPQNPHSRNRTVFETHLWTEFGAVNSRQRGEVRRVERRGAQSGSDIDGSVDGREGDRSDARITKLVSEWDLLRSALLCSAREMKTQYRHCTHNQHHLL